MKEKSLTSFKVSTLHVLQLRVVEEKITIIYIIRRPSKKIKNLSVYFMSIYFMLTVFMLNYLHEWKKMSLRVFLCLPILKF